MRLSRTRADPRSRKSPHPKSTMIGIRDEAAPAPPPRAGLRNSLLGSSPRPAGFRKTWVSSIGRARSAWPVRSRRRSATTRLFFSRPARESASRSPTLFLGSSMRSTADGSLSCRPTRSPSRSRSSARTCRFQRGCSSPPRSSPGTQASGRRCSSANPITSAPRGSRTLSPSGRACSTMPVTRSSRGRRLGRHHGDRTSPRPAAVPEPGGLGRGQCGFVDLLKAQLRLRTLLLPAGAGARPRLPGDRRQPRTSLFADQRRRGPR